MKIEPSGFIIWVRFGILLMLTILLASCNAPTQSETTSGTTAAIGGTTGAAATVANISLTSTPSTITTASTSSIQATVTDSSGNYVADGTTVNFGVSSETYGTVTSSATTSSGIATATFTAASVPGTVTITATSGSASKTVAVVISAPSNGSIEFVSATPQVIGIKGGGQTATSTVQFLVKDTNGNSVVDGTSVSFTLSGPSGGRLSEDGGEYIGDLDESPTTATASTLSGYATVFLNSGSVAGPVTITASVTSGDQTFSASSAVISIGGGVPSATHFDLATTKINLPGLVTLDSQATISAYIADRFGNYNVLTGTSVSFYPEAGAIDRSNVTDETGITSVTFRTQAPDPADVASTTDETTSRNNLNTTYDLSIPSTTNYRDGWVTVLATVQGEEAFNDANANGLYDTGETFTDLGEPFYDKNDDGCRNDGTTMNCDGVISASTDPFEEYIDANGNGSYDGPNDVWDGPGCIDTDSCQTSKMIWTSIPLAFTGSAYYCAITPSTFSLSALNGGSQSFSVMVGDLNTNRLVSETTIDVEASAGALAGIKSYTVLDGLPTGPTEISFTISTPADSSPSPSIITVTVDSSVGGCTITASGSIE